MKFQLRLVAGLWLACLIVVGAFAYFQFVEDRERLTAELDRRASLVSEGLKEALEPALGPTTPTALPAFSVKLTSCTTSFCSPGGATPNASAVNVCVGAGSSSRGAAAGIAANSWPSRCQLWRAATKPFQLAMARSSG